MNKNIHITVGIITGVLLINELDILTPMQSLLCLSATTLGSILPDIDTPKSYIGNRLLLISYPIYKIFGHRTITHSLLFWTVLLLISPCLYQGIAYGSICIGLYWGILSHLLLDTISPVGIPIFYPLSKFRLHLLPHKKYTRKKKRLPI